MQWYSQLVLPILGCFSCISLSNFARTSLDRRKRRGKARLEVEALSKDYSLDMPSYKETHKAAELFPWADAALSKQVIKSASATAFYCNIPASTALLLSFPAVLIWSVHSDIFNLENDF